MSNQETASFWEGYRQLEEELASGTVQPRKPFTASPTRIPLEQLEVMLSVFQPRVVGDTYATESHIGALMTAMMNETGNVLDPVLIWWSGKRWLILDGHHRLEAYKRLREQGKGAKVIPVTAFKGTLHQAHLKTIELNAKDRLSMDSDDKMTKAWHLVMLDKDMSVRQISSICKVGKSSISRMNTERNKLIEEYRDEWRQQVDGLTWKQVMSRDTVRDFNEEAQDRMKAEWSYRFRKTFGKKPSTQPEIFTEAMLDWSPTTCREVCFHLIAHFKDDLGDDLKELLEDDTEYNVVDDDNDDGDF